MKKLIKLFDEISHFAKALTEDWQTYRGEGVEQGLFPSPSLNCKSSVQLGSVMKAAETATNICVSFVVFSVCCATN